MTTNKNIQFIENKIEEVKNLLFTFDTEYSSLESITYPSANLMINQNKNNHEFFDNYLDRGFKEVFGVGVLRTKNFIYFSCEIPNGRALMIEVELKN